VIWVLYVFLMGTEIEERVNFTDLSTCIQYSQRLKNQDAHQRQAGDKLYIKVFCLPKQVD